jgi:hypothetical protein
MSFKSWYLICESGVVVGVGGGGGTASVVGGGGGGTDVGVGVGSEVRDCSTMSRNPLNKLIKSVFLPFKEYDISN